MRELVTLICTKCKRRNYVTTRSKRGSALALKKFCRFCRAHTLHKEK
ncbi:50S ribosomal protein L33 [Candidatus Aerophobetes bacterium]|uniref:Large ribosomal subunit protein bL33 n=1 Tax=Aerophobetes bacterium TaxID=2030807 RepID=A0A497E4X2_UNCAE|nr:50S ribosomal protein L33 [Candidatus Aerophobetes bacterium]RLE10120.1 MAG: 50S ribosomal protein L33 [Candidatus Aerophobetes bacterium]